MMLRTITTIAIGLLALTPSALAQDMEEARITSSSQAFNESADEAIAALSSRLENFRTPEFGSLSNERFDALVAQIRREEPISPLSAGDRGVRYDVILQPGHYGRRTGRVGTSGALVSERALVAYVVAKTAEALRARGFNVLVVSADSYLRDDPNTADFDGLQATAFLAVHADGSVNPCTTGPSLAYSSNSSLLGMHAIGFGLASALGYDYETFRRDNFTANEAQYYMFSKVRAGRLTGLLELGELTCPASERALLTNADQVADNVAYALEFILRAGGQ
jgi:N-acetylmuramoyl-L-alanine amidase